MCTASARLPACVLLQALAPFTFSWRNLGIALVSYMLTNMVGICLSYHRLLTHRYVGGVGGWVGGTWQLLLLDGWVGGWHLPVIPHAAHTQASGVGGGSVLWDTLPAGVHDRGPDTQIGSTGSTCGYIQSIHVDSTDRISSALKPLM